MKYYLKDSLANANKKEYFSEELEGVIDDKTTLRCYCKVNTANSTYDAPLIKYKETSKETILEIWIDSKNLTDVILDKVNEISIHNESKAIKKFNFSDNKLLLKKASYINVDIFKVKYKFLKEN